MGPAGPRCTRSPSSPSWESSFLSGCGGGCGVTVHGSPELAPPNPSILAGPRCTSSAVPLWGARPLRHSRGCSWGASPRGCITRGWVTGGGVTGGCVSGGGCCIARGWVTGVGGASPGGWVTGGGASPGGAGSVICSLQERCGGDGRGWERTMAGSGVCCRPGREARLLAGCRVAL